jgi:hypothetical protein
MIANKQEFFRGVAMMVAFMVVLFILFMPIFGGQNGLNYLDNLYNSISKGSIEQYIPHTREKAEHFVGSSITVTLAMADEEQAQQTSLLFTEAGALVNLSGSELNVSGDLGRILESSLADAERMYYNEGEKLSGRYGYNPRQALYNWWVAQTEMEQELKRQEKFKEAAIVSTVISKALESSYNYYQIAPDRIGDRIGIVIVSLVFYVIYTLWYGFAILFMFEGWGLRLEH